MFVSLKTIIPPTTLTVVTLADLKAQVRLELSETYEDDLLTAFIHAAREQVEIMTLRAIELATYRALYTGFPNKRYLYIPRPPLVGDVTVKYYDSDGILTVLPPSEYVVEQGEPCRIVFKRSVTLPPLTNEHNARLMIEYQAGYLTKESCPPLLRHCIKLLAADYYVNRAANTTYNLRPVPNQLQCALATMQVKIDEGFYENNPY